MNATDSTIPLCDRLRRVPGPKYSVRVTHGIFSHTPLKLYLGTIHVAQEADGGTELHSHLVKWAMDEVHPGMGREFGIQIRNVARKAIKSYRADRRFAIIWDEATGLECTVTEI